MEAEAALSWWRQRRRGGGGRGGGGVKSKAAEAAEAKWRLRRGVPRERSCRFRAIPACSRSLKRDHSELFPLSTLFFLTVFTLFEKRALRVIRSFNSLFLHARLNCKSGHHLWWFAITILGSRGDDVL